MKQGISKAKSKKEERLERSELARKKERKKIVKAIEETGMSSVALDPVVEMYLDAFETHFILFEEWREKGFKRTEKKKDKDDKRVDVRLELAKDVKDWSKEKSRLLIQLGLDGKNKNIRVEKDIKNEEKSNENHKKTSKNSGKLVDFRQKYGG